MRLTNMYCHKRYCNNIARSGFRFCMQKDCNTHLKKKSKLEEEE